MAPCSPCGLAMLGAVLRRKIEILTANATADMTKATVRYQPLAIEAA